MEICRFRNFFIPSQARRADRVRFENATPNRRCLQSVCWAKRFLVSSATSQIISPGAKCKVSHRNETNRANQSVSNAIVRRNLDSPNLTNRRTMRSLILSLVTLAQGKTDGTDGAQTEKNGHEFVHERREAQRRSAGTARLWATE